MKLYSLQVLNSRPDWEVVNRVFQSEQEAVDYYYAELNMFEDYLVEEILVE